MVKAPSTPTRVAGDIAATATAVAAAENRSVAEQVSHFRCFIEVDVLRIADKIHTVSGNADFGIEHANGERGDIGKPCRIVKNSAFIICDRGKGIAHA